jgi:hypothetical protein
MTDPPPQHEITFLLEKSMQEESIAYWYKIFTLQEVLLKFYKQFSILIYRLP